MSQQYAAWCFSFHFETAGVKIEVQDPRFFTMCAASSMENVYYTRKYSHELRIASCDI